MKIKKTGEKCCHKWTIVLFLTSLVLFSACSRRKVPPPPKVQPELLLEIYDAARKNQYETALQKIRKLRVLDPTSIVLGEMENAIQFNRMSAVVNHYLQIGNFEAALSSIQRYEKQYGFSDATTNVKNQLFVLARLNMQIENLKNTHRADIAEAALKELDQLKKEVKISSKIENFIQNRRSMLKQMRITEHENLRHYLWAESMQQIHEGNLRTGSALTAVLAAEAPFYPGLNDLISEQNKYATGNNNQ